ILSVPAWPWRMHDAFGAYDRDCGAAVAGVGRDGRDVELAAMDSDDDRCGTSRARASPRREPLSGEAAEDAGWDLDGDGPRPPRAIGLGDAAVGVTAGRHPSRIGLRAADPKLPGSRPGWDRRASDLAGISVAGPEV